MGLDIDPWTGRSTEAEEIPCGSGDGRRGADGPHRRDSDGGRPSWWWRVPESGGRDRATGAPECQENERGARGEAGTRERGRLWCRGPGCVAASAPRRSEDLAAILVGDGSPSVKSTRGRAKGSRGLTGPTARESTRRPDPWAWKEGAAPGVDRSARARWPDQGGTLRGWSARSSSTVAGPAPGPGLSLCGDPRE